MEAEQPSEELLAAFASGWEQPFRILFDKAPLAMMLLTPEGVPFLVNPAFCQMLERNPEDILGRHYSAWTHPLDLDDCEALMERLRAGRSTHESIEKRYLRQDGGIVWGLACLEVLEVLQTTTLPSATARPLICTIHDLSDRQQTLAALRASEVRLREAQRIAQIGSWELCHRSGRITLSPEVYRIFEIDLPELDSSGQADPRAVPEEIVALLDEVRYALQNQQPLATEQRIQLRDGEVRYLHIRSETRFDRLGRPEHSSGILQDITSRRRNERELRQRNAELERFNRASIGREMAMIELKRQINQLSAELGRPEPFPLDFLTARRGIDEH